MALDYNPSGLPKEDLTPVYNMPTPRRVICERETEAFILSHKNHLLNETSCCISLLDHLNSAIGTENAIRVAFMCWSWKFYQCFCIERHL